MTTRREFSRALVGGAGALGLGCGGALAPFGRVVRGPEFHRGVNFTAERPDRYESEDAKALLRRLTEYGVDSVAFVPYGFCRKDSPEVRFNSRRSWERDPAVKELASIAHDSGMRVLLKPQLWVPQGFPGDLDYGTTEDRKVWFGGYELFLRHYSKLAEEIGAELFSVGVEFSKLIQYEAEWRGLIALARDEYSGPVVYSANWGDEFESINFWDEVDFIGLNNYYPLPDDLSMTGIVEKVVAVQRRFERPVIFPEAGYPSLRDPQHEPWSEEPRELSLEDQARCYEAVFEAFYEQPWFEGVYWWKVPSNGSGGPHDGSHSPWRKPAMDVMARWYLKGKQS